MTQKQRSLTLFGVIVLLAGGLAAYAWLGVYQVDKKKDQEKSASETLFTFKKDQVKKLAVTSHNQTVVGSLGDAGWVIDSPLQVPADKFAFDSIAEKLAGLKEKRDIGDQANLTEYGLDAPKVKAVVTLDDGKTEELDLGKDNPYDSTIYGKRASEARVAILDSAVKFPLDKGLFELRDKRILPALDPTSGNTLTRLDVAGPNLAYSLERGADGKWKVTAPSPMQADSARCTQIENALKNLRATRFVTDQASQEDLSHEGLDKPLYTVQLTLSDQNKAELSRTLTLAKEKEGATDHVYVKRADQPFIAEVPTSILKDLDVTLADLRDKTILSLDASAIQGFKFLAGGVSFEAHKSVGAGDGGTETWTLANGASGPAKKWKLSALASTLHDFKGAAIVTDNADGKALVAAGLDHPAKVVTVLGEGDKELATLRIGKTDQSKVDVQVAGSPRIYQVDAYKLTNVPATPAEIADAPAIADGGTSTARK